MHALDAVQPPPFQRGAGVVGGAGARDDIVVRDDARAELGEVGDVARHLCVRDDTVVRDDARADDLGEVDDVARHLGVRGAAVVRDGVRAELGEVGDVVALAPLW